MWITLTWLSMMSLFGFLLTLNIIPKFGEMFIKAGLFGIDMSKISKQKIPEATGNIILKKYIMHYHRLKSMCMRLIYSRCYNWLRFSNDHHSDDSINLL